MPNITAGYGTAVDATITLASLASDTNLLIGRQSTEIINTSDLFLDFLVSCKITTGATITAGRSIEVWAVASIDGTSYLDNFSTTDASRTVSSNENKLGLCRLVAQWTPTTTANTTYTSAPVSIASLFGGVCPPKFVLWVVQSTGSALNATAGNHQIRVQPYREAF